MPTTVAIPTPQPRSKWANALSHAKDVSDDLDKVAVGALHGSQADKALCLAHIKTLGWQIIESRRTSGSWANECRWREIPV